MVTQVRLMLPIRPGLWVALDGFRPMTPAEWDQMMRVLEAMRPGLVEEHAEASEEARHPASEPTGGMPEV
jgi:hypothetical protein